eukprot:g3341.t1
MPTLSVQVSDVTQGIGEEYGDPEVFQTLCFEFGVELDPEEVVEEEINRNEFHPLYDPNEQGKIQQLFKIDVPANRYDLLCREGLVTALRIFLGKESVPNFHKVPQPLQLAAENPTKMIVAPSTASIRPFVVCAVLRNVTFTKRSYESFIKLQEILHHNICRGRTLVAIGTHDLDTIQGPFRYEARAPQDIKFKPLKRDKEFRGDELIEFYENDPRGKDIKPYVKIIKDSPVYPVIYDKNGVVLSLPPLINGEHSKITLETKNVFIECTATDKTKANIVLDTVCCMFSQYCANPYEIESVDVEFEEPVVSPFENTTIKSYVTPDLNVYEMRAQMSYIRSLTGIENIAPEVAIQLLTKMMLPGEYDSKTDEVVVVVPPTRSDVLHACDVAEDVGIAYGYNKIKEDMRVPPVLTTGKELPINLLSDLLRLEIAQAGYTEVLTLALISKEEAFDFMGVPKEDRPEVVELSRPKTIEFQMCRTQLVPGLLKCLQENKEVEISSGLRIFEISDVVLVDRTTDTNARNERHLAALYTGNTSGTEIVHGLVDRVFQLMDIAPATTYAGASDAEKLQKKADAEKGTYALRADASNKSYFPGRCANIVHVRNDGAEVIVGQIGALHPDVLGSFKLKYPVSVVEINLQYFLGIV